MANKKSILFLDSSFLIAFLIPTDSLHSEAIKMAKSVKNYDRIIISQYIYLEVATVLSQKMGKSINLSNELKEMGVELVFIEGKYFQKAIAQYPKIKDKDISFVDLVTSLYIKMINNVDLFTFDKHFNGLLLRHHLA